MGWSITRTRVASKISGHGESNLAAIARAYIRQPGKLGSKMHCQNGPRRTDLFDDDSPDIMSNNHDLSALRIHSISLITSCFRVVWGRELYLIFILVLLLSEVIQKITS